MKNSPPTLTGDELFLLFDELRKHAGSATSIQKALRNYTMALLMVDAGLRVGEVVALEMSDLYIDSNPVQTLLVRAKISKNKKERTVPLSPRLRETLTEYREDWPWLEFAGLHSWAFCTSFQLRPISTRQVERIIRTAAVKSIGRPITPHVLRHTFASRLMQRTNIRVVQELLGHSSVISTQIYTHPNENHKKHAIQQLCLETNNGGSLTGLPKTFA